MSFRIAQISDTHLSAEKPFFVANFAAIGGALRAMDVQLVLNSGDVSIDGANSDADLVEALRLHAALGLPVRFIPGNHDVGDNLDADDDEGHAINLTRHGRYRSVFGPDWWQMDVPGWRIVGVDAQLLGANFDAAREQDAFIAEAMSSGRQVALFIHKPLCDMDEGESAVGGRFLNPALRRRLLDLFGGARPALIASGHVHQFRSSHIGGVHHVWAPSTGFVIPDTRQPIYGLKQVGYVIHDLHENGTHESKFATADGTTTLSIGDFPSVYGPLD